MVREGNLNYAEALEDSASLSTGVRISGRDPVQQMQFSCVTFVGLCTRAAIEGGLPADTAYTVGDAYLQQIASTRSVTDLTSIIDSMYGDFIARVHQVRSQNGLSGAVSACAEYIRMHAEEDISVRDLARMSGYAEYYLTRKFKAETGMGINEYIHRIRIDRARFLLSTTRDPVADIAARLGYCSAGYFTKVFYKLEKMNPASYRKEHFRS